MADVAAAAGVSKITVSRALAGSPLVSPATRERITQLARDCGYKLNVSARNFRQQRSHLVAVIVEMTPSSDRTMLDPYPLSLLGGISQELAEAGYGVLLTTRAGMASSSVRTADGVILLGQGVNRDSVKLCDEMGVPLVVWGADDDGDDHVIVGSDNVRGGASVAEHFLAIGRHCPVFIGDSDHLEVAQRLTGFVNALAEHDIKPLFSKRVGWTMDSGAEAVRSMIDRGVQFDAVFAGSDLLAMGAIRGLEARDLKVPDDVSVVGYDDIPLGLAFTPPLSSVRQDWHEGGALLARKVLALLDGKPAESQKMSTALIVRKT
ncbi:MAG TPA: LacI family DNA-binding transcriptional regulator [Oleiagrimonas sp.]|nr:LacI family DNA-binding transcriptional regulator [Oleiagrimonas sp.]